MEYENPREGFAVSFKLPPSFEKDNKGLLTQSELVKAVASDTDAIRYEFLKALERSYAFRCNNPSLIGED